jgi:hypothetical protein
MRVELGRTFHTGAILVYSYVLESKGLIEESLFIHRTAQKTNKREIINFISLCSVFSVPFFYIKVPKDIIFLLAPSDP